MMGVRRRGLELDDVNAMDEMMRGLILSRSTGWNWFEMKSKNKNYNEKHKIAGKDTEKYNERWSEK